MIYVMQYLESHNYQQGNPAKQINALQEICEVWAGSETWT